MAQILIQYAQKTTYLTCVTTSNPNLKIRKEKDKYWEHYKFSCCCFLKGVLLLSVVEVKRYILDKVFKHFRASLCWCV